MTTVLSSVGMAVGAVLIGLLILSIVRPGWRIWPTPGDGSWQGYVFWPLFRSLNVLCVAVAVSAFFDRAPFLGIPWPVRGLALALLAAAVALFVYSFRMLGRDNSYCATDGLVTGGIYRWSRNPQNAMLVVVYGCLAVAADSAPAWLLCAAMMAVYTLMVLAEEPWLGSAYGDAYQRYCRRVPRFFNWRRAALLTRTALRRRHAGHPGGAGKV